MLAGSSVGPWISRQWEVQSTGDSPQPAATVHLLPLDLPGDALASCERVISSSEAARADRFKFAEDRSRFIAARGQLRMLLAGELRLSASEVALAVGPHGKPFLDHCHMPVGLEFSLAHSGDLALVGIARGSPIGVDLEARRPLADVHGLAASVFSREELLAWRALEESEQADAFFRLWTRKEAVLKAWGVGLNHSMPEITVSFAPDLSIIRREDACWSVISIAEIPDYFSAVSISADVTSVRGVHAAHPGEVKLE